MERFVIRGADSRLEFFAMSDLHPLQGRATGLSGFVEGQWTAEGKLSEDPAPTLHVEFPVDRLRTGNDAQDREMWKTIDDKRFPRVEGDVRELRGAPDGRYGVRGEIALHGRARHYEGEMTIVRDGERIVIEGELQLDVRDFGLEPVTLLILSVRPVVRIRAHVEAYRDGLRAGSL